MSEKNVGCHAGAFCQATIRENRLAPPGELPHRPVVDGESHAAVSPPSPWIPAGVRHSANGIRGHGTSGRVRLARTADAFPAPQD